MEIKGMGLMMLLTLLLYTYLQSGSALQRNCQFNHILCSIHEYLWRYLNTLRWSNAWFSSSRMPFFDQKWHQNPDSILFYSILCVLIVSGLSDMAIKGYKACSVLSSTQELVTILTKCPQHLLRAPNETHISRYRASEAKESAQNSNLRILQLNSDWITLAENA